jgi:hypothetical protein
VGHDVIGDVHGHAEALTALLRKLGYRERMGAWRHADRTAAFVGDLIDRGPAQLAAVDVARRMIDGGSAVAVMGNHELNAIAWTVPDPAAPGEFLRRHWSPRHGDRNRAQHARFLAEVEGRPDLHAELVGWFLTLPLWIDLPGLRLVHACWHPRLMAHLAPALLPGNRLPRELLAAATREPEDESEKDTPEPTVFKAVEALTKGLEVPMPDGLTFPDKEGHVRDRVRIRWWDPGATTYRAAALGLDGALRERLPDLPLPAHARLGYGDAKPVFVGHYWRRGAPAPLGPRVACVDYSVAMGGELCAYRFDGEPALEAARFVSVRPGGG